ncbi:Metallo-dependent phosphatase [Anaeromyces robustus]|uniref:Metallo-dependent phosphatase n=1 Tax=Anaeromyces robustus TaxID=1754192 RepID=A0A1Y1W7I3_9FUNG|nr:Metallo-dependent phosphatase [Anaeromyces robustus]|eukprot:ORX69345.1 Metallo-dependent phosphatase [Anaeromyces robustus]
MSKFQIPNFLLILVLFFQLSYSEISEDNKNNGYIKNSKIKTNKNFIYKSSDDKFHYNFYCLEDNNNKCDLIKNDVHQAIELLSKNSESSRKFEFDVIVDDFLKYEFINKQEIITIILDKDISTSTSSSYLTLLDNDNNNSKNLIYQPLIQVINSFTTTNKFRKRDFIILLNNFKNVQIQLDSQINYKALILNEIIKELNESTEIQLNTPKIYARNENNLSRILSVIGTWNEVINDTLNIFGSYKSFAHWNNTLISSNIDTFSLIDNKYKRIIAVGDIHGDYNKLLKIMKHAKLIDDNNDWIANDSIFVQTGDLIDRGDDSRNIFDLLIKIKNQSKQFGGKVYTLLGNHELMNMQADYRYLSPNDVAEYGDIVNRENAFSLNGEYGNFLRREMDPIAVVGDTLFIHAGLTSEYAYIGVDDINERIHDLLINAPSYDELYKFNEQQNYTHPIFSDPLFSDYGPLWTRFLSLNINEQAVCNDLDVVFDIVKVKRMVIGHTVQDQGKINSKCNNRLILIDIGLSDYYGSYFGYLEFLKETKEIWAIYN